MARLKPGKSVETSHRRVLPKLLRRYFARGREAAWRNTSIRDLHRFRIRTMRVRYVAEIHEPLFPRELSTVVRQLRAIQQVLAELQYQGMVAASFERKLVLTTNGNLRAEYERIVTRAQLAEKKCRRTFRMMWAALETTGFQKKLPRLIGR